MINIINPADCCGCTACASVCTQSAITMEPDALGFLYPKVNVVKCTDCGQCEKVCAFNDNYDKSLNLPKPDVYGARHKDIHEVETSRSGAAFIAISDYILEQGGVVYGVGYKEHFRVCHKRATTKEGRDEFKGSKYVQSDLTGIFRQIKQDLKNGQIVLFSGTPCQTAGLNSYIGKKLRENLFLVDIVCHGVPGPNLWRDYIKYIEHIQNDKICRVNFRDKQQFGWSAHRESFELCMEIGKKFFKESFYKHIMFRHSCGICHFCNTMRPSDITIADFWGWHKTNSDFNKDDKGVSLIFVNTEKGRKVFEIIQEVLNVFVAEMENVLQPNLKSPCAVHIKRMMFEDDYIKKGFAYVINKDYDKLSIIKRTSNKAKRVIKKLLGK